MGPTGCGKTSMLNILAARVESGGSSLGKLSGSIYINGRKRNDDALQRMSAYVLQDDRLYPHLTVYETLLLAANFYLPFDTSDEKKEELVNKVIGELGLSKVRDTIIGDEKIRGVSGGERKRANIATQMISEPPILFLDEPTRYRIIKSSSSSSSSSLLLLLLQVVLIVFKLNLLWIV